MFNPDAINQIARNTGFVTRKSKLTGNRFLLCLMLSFQLGKHYSLLDMVFNLFRSFGIKITKQSLHERFNQKAVAFFRGCLDCLLSGKLSPSDGHSTFLESHFNRVRVKDSTRFALPGGFAEKYRGYGGATHNSASMISIQYEYDLLTGQSLDLRLTSGTQNDQSDSRDFTHDIRKGDLFIRDLAYSTLDYMEAIDRNGAYFINRLSPNTYIYANRHDESPIDLEKVMRDADRKKVPTVELEVFIGAKKRLPCRLVVSRVDEASYEKRLRETSKQTKSHGHKVSDGFKLRARLNLFITNVPAELLSVEKVREAYTLRWQIELIFKVWKSQMGIHYVKGGNIERFECQLYGKLIYLTLNTTLFYHLLGRMYRQYNMIGSIWKYFKYISVASDDLLLALRQPGKLAVFIADLLEMAPNLLKLEEKKNKLSLNQTITLLT